MPDGTSVPPRRVLVTGATGFLGSPLTRELLSRGHSVVALVRDRAPAGEFLAERLWRQVRVVRGRVEDRGRLRQLLAIHDIDAVAHLAAPPSAANHEYHGDFLHGVAEAVAEVAPGSAVVAPAHRLARRHAEELALTLPAPVRFELLPTLFGRGDRRSDRLAPRTARALVTGERCQLPTAVELSDAVAPAAEAARLLADALELSPLPAGADGEVRDRLAPRWSGADLFAALTGRSSIRQADPALAAAADDILAWSRLRFARAHAPALAAA